jgi:hypothetical protein
MSIKTFLKYICSSLEVLCCATHPLVRFEIFLTGRHCNLTYLSLLLDDKYDLGVWKMVKPNETYYPDYSVRKT